MEFPWSKKPSTNAHSGDDTSGTSRGTDYYVTYQLDQYQSGSMVLRFSRPPSKADLLSKVADYGLRAGDIKDISATPLSRRLAAPAEPTHREPVALPQPPRSDSAHVERASQNNFSDPAPATWLPTPPPVRQRSLEERRQAQSKKKAGCLGPLLGIILAGYIGVAITADNSYVDGQLSNYATDYNANFFEKISQCNDIRTDRAASKEVIWGERPGLFEDRTSTFALHPANLAFMAGCLKD